MIRFVDLGTQLSGNDEAERQFAFYDTVTDSFIRICGSSAWESWDEFDSAWKAAVGESKDELERYRGLCPGWVFVISCLDTNG